MRDPHEPQISLSKISPSFALGVVQDGVERAPGARGAGRAPLSPPELELRQVGTNPRRMSRRQDPLVDDNWHLEGGVDRRERPNFS